MVTQLTKNPTINGVKFKTLRIQKRDYHMVVVDGREILIAYSGLDPLVTGKPQAWFWDKEGVGTSRTTQTYFDTPEAAFAAALTA